MEWIEKQIATGFSDLKGLSITATVPVKDRLINEAIAEFLQSTASAPPSGLPAKADLRKLLPLVRKAQVRAIDGAVVLDIVVSV